MSMVTPFEEDWTNIASITGNNSWDPEYMRSYFVKIERLGYAVSSTVGHGFDGWLNIGEQNRRPHLWIPCLTAVGFYYRYHTPHTRGAGSETRGHRDGNGYSFGKGIVL
jgi:hypothetical protein